MKKYKYKSIQDDGVPEITKKYLNDLGEIGWRLVNVTLYDSGQREILLELEEEA